MKMRKLSNIPIWQRKKSTELQVHITFKRIYKKKYETYFERTKRGKEQVRRFIAKKYPWFFILSTQHSYGYTRKGTKLRRQINESI